jgi:outer membrane receptor protein involved in Fe transport
VPFDQNQTARDTGVGVYIDGVYLGRSQGLNAALFDVQRIEVLKGPQGTLFGRNTEGGAVSIVTRDPSGKFEGRVVAGVGNYGSHSVEGHIDLPESTISPSSSTVSSSTRIRPSEPSRRSGGLEPVRAHRRPRFGEMDPSAQFLGHRLL